MNIAINFSEFFIMQLLCLHTDSNKILYPSFFEFPRVEAHLVHKSLLRHTSQKVQQIM